MYNFYQHQNNSRLHSSCSNRSKSRVTHSVETINRYSDQTRDDTTNNQKSIIEKLQLKHNEYKRRLNDEIDISLNVKTETKKEQTKENYQNKYKEQYQNQNMKSQKVNDENICLKDIFTQHQSQKGQQTQLNDRYSSQQQNQLFNRTTQSKQIQREHSKSINESSYIKDQNKMNNIQCDQSLSNNTNNKLKQNNNQYISYDQNIKHKNININGQQMVKNSQIDSKQQDIQYPSGIYKYQQYALTEPDEYGDNQNIGSQIHQRIKTDQSWNTENDYDDKNKERSSTSYTINRPYRIYSSLDKSSESFNSNTQQSFKSRIKQSSNIQSMQDKTIQFIHQNIQQNNKRPPIVFKQNQIQVNKSVNRERTLSKQESTNKTKLSTENSEQPNKNNKKLFRIDLKKIAPKNNQQKKNLTLESIDIQQDEYQSSYRSNTISELSEREAKIKEQKYKTEQNKILKDKIIREKYIQKLKMNNNFISPLGFQSYQLHPFPGNRSNQSRDSLFEICKVGEVTILPEEIGYSKNSNIKDKFKYDSAHSSKHDYNTTPILSKPQSLKSHSCSRKNSRVRFGSYGNNQVRCQTDCSQSKYQTISINQYLIESVAENQKNKNQEQINNLSYSSQNNKWNMDDQSYMENNPFYASSSQFNI